MCDTVHWNIGLVSALNEKYLTAETFGFKLNCDGASLKKKQTWILLQGGDGNSVCLRSHLGRFLSADAKGNVTCEAEEIVADCMFTVEIMDGKWALKSTHGAYFGATGDQLKCVAKVGKTELWTVRLARHPQVNLKNVFRKKYAHLDEKSGDVKGSEIHPWDATAIFTLKFTGGKYYLMTSDGRYLGNTGDLHCEPNEDCAYTIGFQQNSIVFRDVKGGYLTAVGTGRLQCKKKTIGKDELFQLEDFNPQVSFIGHTNKRVSFKQHNDLRANQSDRGQHETFQLEFNADNSRVSLLCCNGKYWTASGPVTATGECDCQKSQFAMEYHNNQVAFRTHSGNYLTSNKQGQLLEGGPELTREGRFVMEIVNFQSIIFKGEHGFLGVRPAANRIECNRANFDVFKMEAVGCEDVGCVEEQQMEQKRDQQTEQQQERSFDERGATYKLASQNGKYWRVDADGNVSLTDQNAADEFEIYMQRKNVVIIKAPNGKYLQGQQNGVFTATGAGPAKGQQPTKDILWEY